MVTTTKKAAAKKAAPVEEPEEVEAEEVAFGVADIATHLTKKHKLEKPVTTRELRTLIRKMARDGRVDREIIPGNRTRYAWSGLNDPEVKKIIKAYDDGELEADKQEKLAALKARKADAKKTAEAPAKKAAKKTAKKAAAVEEVEDEDEELELDDEE